MQVDKTNTRDTIFKTAVVLFSRKGYHGTSVRDIAREVGIKESSLYNHFNGKEAILDGILAYQMDVFDKAVHALDALKSTDVDDLTDPVEFWMAGTREFLKYMDPTSGLISRILINEMYLNQKCREFYLDTMTKARKDLVKALFSEMRKKEMIRDCGIEMTADHYVYLLQGLEIEHTLRELDGEDPGVLKNELIGHITLFIQGLAQ